MSAKRIIFYSLIAGAVGTLIVRPDIREDLQKSIERLKLALAQAYEEGRIEALRKEAQLDESLKS